ncbi:2OG-Fe(II) oxygenase family protein [Siminovitchia sediminis]|uniref:2OG-Fe(II) oxygenase family protein n=1 Tax=Siminovitchia sediminis TaxID=1274353 RepID=A0ABW4KKP4_9BACI
MNEKQFEKTKFYNKPFSYGIVSSPVQLQYRNELIKEFPEDGFKTVKKTSEGKSYQMNHRTFINEQDGQANLDGLSPIWEDLYSDLTSSLYRDMISEITKKKLKNCKIGASFWQYDERCFLSPHTDKPEKVVTHLIYMEDSWQERRGGCLHLHLEEKSYPIFRTIIPVIDNSVLLVTSENSWHSVSPVLGEKWQRKSLQIVFWND